MGFLQNLWQQQCHFKISCSRIIHSIFKKHPPAVACLSTHSLLNLTRQMVCYTPPSGKALFRTGWKRPSAFKKTWQVIGLIIYIYCCLSWAYINHPESVSFSFFSLYLQSQNRQFISIVNQERSKYFLSQKWDSFAIWVRNTGGVNLYPKGKAITVLFLLDTSSHTWHLLANWQCWASYCEIVT